MELKIYELGAVLSSWNDINEKWNDNKFNEVTKDVIEPLSKAPLRLFEKWQEIEKTSRDIEIKIEQAKGDGYYG